jgi:hypothetical protein
MANQQQNQLSFVYTVANRKYKTPQLLSITTANKTTWDVERQKVAKN